MVRYEVTLPESGYKMMAFTEDAETTVATYRAFGWKVRLGSSIESDHDEAG